MKNNQVYLDPTDVESSLRQIKRFYRLDHATLEALRPVISSYPKPVIMYVDEANAPLFANSLLDDLFTFNTQTGELVLFSSDPMTFIDAFVEMWMYVSGFETLMGDEQYWRVEFAIGAWKPVKNGVKKQFSLPARSGTLGVVGLPPEADELILDDPYPFLTLVSKFTLFSFIQMVRLAGREEVRVHFPEGTDPRVIEVYHTMRRFMHEVGDDLSINDVDEFNRRLHAKLDEIERIYDPAKLPVPEEWQGNSDSRDAASGEIGKSSSDDNKQDSDNQQVGLLLGPTDEESPLGRLLKRLEERNREKSMSDIDRKLADGPFGEFIEELFKD